MPKRSSYLRQSKSPLIGGLDGLSTQSQITAVEIAKRVRATSDTTFTNRRRGGTLTMQSVGKVTATLGELASRADVVLFWCCDPATTHPRFFERFCQKADQTVLIDHSRTETAKFVSQFVQLDRTAVYGLLSELRLASNNSDRNNISEHGREILDVLQNAEYVASVYGGLNDDPNQNEQSAGVVSADAAAQSTNSGGCNRPAQRCQRSISRKCARLEFGLPLWRQLRTRSCRIQRARVFGAVRVGAGRVRRGADLLDDFAGGVERCSAGQFETDSDGGDRRFCGGIGIHTDDQV